MRKLKLCNTPTQEFTVEAYMMDLTQDEDMLVLRASKDTDSKKPCVEVRGKKNYEIDGYDPKDKLHPILDKLDPTRSCKIVWRRRSIFKIQRIPRTAPAIAMAKKLTQKVLDRT